MNGKISVSIDVSDTERAIKFYPQALNCEFKKRYSEDWAVVNLGGLDMHLLKKEVATLAAGSDKRRFNRHWTPIHFDFGVDEISAAAQRIEDNGGVVEEVHRAEVADIAHCSDPFGNGFCLI